jgi:hypothetical protein
MKNAFGLAKPIDKEVAVVYKNEKTDNIDGQVSMF